MLSYFWVLGLASRDANLDLDMTKCTRSKARFGIVRCSDAARDEMGLGKCSTIRKATSAGKAFALSLAPVDIGVDLD